MTVEKFINELNQLPKDYNISICGIEDFEYAINIEDKEILIDEETPIEDYCDAENSRYTRLIISHLTE